MQLDELLPDEELRERMIGEGFVREQFHPILPLSILNYTQKAAFEGKWNCVTRTCRGLIVCTETQQVVSRPFPKFFNYGQEGAPEIDMNEPVIVTDKLDGSLGILYWDPTGKDFSCRIATRGSFASEQALHASEVLQKKYGDVFFNTACTYLFEIIYPENRIVVDYGDRDDLVLIEVLETKTGLPAWDDKAWPGEIAESFAFSTFGEALMNYEARPNAEGIVIYLPQLDERVKVKQEDYITLHRIVTGLTTRRVWEWLRNGMTWSEMVELVPDEFHDWVRETAEKLIIEHTNILWDIRSQYDAILTSLPKDFSRKDFAKLATQSQYPWAMFIHLDSNSRNEGPGTEKLRGKVWDMIKPEAGETPTGRDWTEEAA